MSFDSMLAEFGLTLEVLRPLYESLEDQIPFDGSQVVETGLSAVDGIGIFSQRSFEPGDCVALCRHGRKRTPVGRYTNHSDSPNARVIHIDTDLYLEAIKPIALGEEILIDYREAFRVSHE